MYRPKIDIYIDFRSLYNLVNKIESTVFSMKNKDGVGGISKTILFNLLSSHTSQLRKLRDTNIREKGFNLMV